MNKNVGNFDRILRIVLGAGIGGAGIYFRSWFGLIGIIPLLTAFIGWCPLYIPCGIKTSSKES